MVKIRLSRGGSKKRPFYQIVVTDRRNSRDSGSFIERVGYYNPKAVEHEVKIHVDEERINYWLAQGAQASERVAYLLKQRKAA